MFASTLQDRHRLRAVAGTLGRGAAGATSQLVVDLAAALFPAGCRSCGRSLPADEPATSATMPRRIASLVDGRIRRRLPGGIELPSWFACRDCAATLSVRARPSELANGVACVTVFAPEPLLFALVHAFKYEAQRQLCDWFARRLAVAARAHWGCDFVLVPVPSHPRRIRERGFDATASLAEGVARRAGVAVAAGTVVRCRATPAQARLPHGARAANVAGAFARAGRVPHRSRIVILDDVVTTGATVGAVCAALGRPQSGLAVLALCRARDPGMQDAARL